MDAEVKKAQKSLRAVLVKQRGGPLPAKRRKWWELIFIVLGLIMIGPLMGIGTPAFLVISGGSWQEPLGGKICGLVVLGLWFTAVALIWSGSLLQNSYDSPRVRMLATLPVSPMEILELARWRWLRSVIYVWIYACLVTGWLGLRAWMESRGAAWLGSSPWEWVGWGTMFALHAAALALLLAGCQMLLLKWRKPVGSIRLTLISLLGVVLFAALNRDQLLSATQLTAWSEVLAKWLPTLWGMWALTSMEGGSLLPYMSGCLVLIAAWVWWRWPRWMLWKVLEYPKTGTPLLRTGAKPEKHKHLTPAETALAKLSLAERMRAVYSHNELEVGWQERLLMRGWGEEERTIYRCRAGGIPSWTRYWYWAVISLLIWLVIWMLVRPGVAEWMEKQGEDPKTFNMMLIVSILAAYVSLILSENRTSLQQDAMRRSLASRFLPISPRKIMIQEWKIMIGRVVLMFPIWLATAGWVAWTREFRNFGFSEALILVVKLTMILLSTKPMFFFTHESGGSHQQRPSTGSFWVKLLQMAGAVVLVLGYFFVAGFMVWCGGSYWWQLLITLVGTSLLLVSSYVCYSLTLSGLNRQPINFPQRKYS